MSAKRKVEFSGAPVKRHTQFLNEDSIAEQFDVACFFGADEDDDLFLFRTDEIDDLVENFKTIIDKSSTGKKHLGLLNKLFTQFLAVRIPEASMLFRKVISFIAVSIVGIVGEKYSDFTPEILWKLLSTKGLLCDHYILIHAASNYAADNINVKGKNLNYVDISLFGEFLYYCTTMKFGCCSPMLAIRKNSKYVEKWLLNSISREITPELGLLFYIVYKNWSSNIGIIYQTRENYIWFPEDLEEEMTHQVCYNYWKSLEKVRKIPLADEYLHLFRRFLGTQICNSGFCFGRGILDIGYFNSLNDCNDIFDQEYRLMFVLKYIHELLLFLHERDPNFHNGDFLDISEFVKIQEIPNENGTFMDLTNYTTSEGWQSVAAMLLAISYFVDFLFLKKWKDRSLCADKFLHIWSSLNSVIKTQCNSVKKFASHFKLFFQSLTYHDEQESLLVCLNN